MLEAMLCSKKLSLLHAKARDLKDDTKMLRGKGLPHSLWLPVEREALQNNALFRNKRQFH